LVFGGAIDYLPSENNKTPARIIAAAGVRFAKLSFAPGIKPS